MQSNFVLIPMGKSYCSRMVDKGTGKLRLCHEKVTLLVNQDPHMSGAPSFFICWSCQAVAEVGVGPCEEPR